ncbi:MAG: tetratricopeptide repeat protein [Blastocatellia bacterium]|nr:tetratricopeptide repeat protein [Blastocatellia bacterium]
MLGAIARSEKNYPEALQRYSEALKLHSQSKNTVGIAVALKGLGDSLLATGQFDQAQTVYAQTLSVLRQIGSQTSESLVFGNLMDLAKKKGIRVWRFLRQAKHQSFTKSAWFD